MFFTQPFRACCLPSAVGHRAVCSLFAVPTRMLKKKEVVSLNTFRRYIIPIHMSRSKSSNQYPLSSIYFWVTFLVNGKCRDLGSTKTKRSSRAQESQRTQPCKTFKAANFPVTCRRSLARSFASGDLMTSASAPKCNF